jgi:nucleoside-diphosphate-sugar epimerase
MKTVFVTGATGFLGGAVVSQLLNRNSLFNLLLLVRATSVCEGLERVRENLEKLETPTAVIDKLTDRNIVLGDFTDVSTFGSDIRFDEVTHVINCAAVTSFGKNPLIWPVNVDGTFAFARRMAEVAKLQRFLHVGTAMACGPSLQSPIRELWDLAPAEEHLVPYTASKAAIEQKLRAELPDLPLVVARPSIVVGHTELGCKPSSSIFWVFRMGQMLGKFTCALNEKIDVVPVDYCADALVKLLLKENLAHDLYHISAGFDSSCTFEAIESAMALSLMQPPIGNAYRQIGRDDLALLAHEFEARVGPCNRRLAIKALRLYAGFAELNYVFDNARLRAEGIPASPLFSSYAGLCAQTTRHLSIQEQMQADFK